MSASRTNNAAWLVSAKAYPLEIRPSPMGIPNEGEILLRNRAIGINPINGKLQYLAIYPLDYPDILGEDVAGEVVAVGPGVAAFKEGDRVMGMSSAFGTKRSDMKAFQEFTVLETKAAARIPADMSFEQAVTIPLCLSTASEGLFAPEHLNLDRPTYPARAANGKVLLIWGGASGVGSNAIQLARAAGYEVVATASPKNFSLVKGVGASHVFDYRSETVVDELLETTNGKSIAGVYDAIGVDGAFEACVKFAQRSQGNKSIATVFNFIKDMPEDVVAKRVFAPSILSNGVTEDIWVKFLPKAIEAGSFVAAIEPVVAGKGLEKIQDAIDTQRKGMSAQKAVVILD